jgi:hypothetical protein
MIPTARRSPALAGLLFAALLSGPSAAGVMAPGAVKAAKASAASAPSAAVPVPAARPAHWLHVRVWETASRAPNVSVRVPTALVSVTVGLLSWTGVFDHAMTHARAHCGDGPGGAHVTLSGRDLVRLWSSLLQGGASQLVAVHSADGSAVEIALE